VAAAPDEVKGRAPGTSAESAVDDFTAIHGIGITIQEHLNRMGITTYAQLADTKPEQLREALGRFSRGAEVEAWINKARELSAGK
jgi:predicted flap endonuclease-1-like 5' DNA nuclease